MLLQKPCKTKLLGLLGFDKLLLRNTRQLQHPTKANSTHNTLRIALVQQQCEDHFVGSKILKRLTGHPTMRRFAAEVEPNLVSSENRCCSNGEISWWMAWVSSASDLHPIYPEHLSTFRFRYLPTVCLKKQTRNWYKQLGDCESHVLQRRAPENMRSVCSAAMVCYLVTDQVFTFSKHDVRAGWEWSGKHKTNGCREKLIIRLISRIIQLTTGTIH